jgi:hypothetical protein
MLYNGGLCTQSDPNQQSGKFECEDFQGGPPTEDGIESYIVVTDAKGKDITYFEGLVRVGENYRLNDGGEPFEADQQIFIYTAAGPSMDNLLQAVQYHSSCSQEFELKQRFGASQLVEFFNEEQGNVSCFAALEFDLDIMIPITIEGEEICLETLTAITNFVGDLDLSEQVAGVCVPPGGTVTVTLGATIDATTQQRYSVLATLTGFEQPSQQFCTGTDFISFVAGGLPGGPTVPPEPENLPSRLLMELPELSTPDQDTAMCDVGAEIYCELVKDGRNFGNCEDVTNPLGVSCSDDSMPTSLSFIFKANKCGPKKDGIICVDVSGVPLPEEVFVEVKAKSVAINFVAGINQFFEAIGVFRDKVKITVSSYLDGGAGEVLQMLEINTSCSSDYLVLTLGVFYGALELAGFENEQGSFTSVYGYQMSYVAKSGLVEVQLTSSIVNSFFESNPFEAITSPVTVGLNPERLVTDSMQKPARRSAESSKLIVHQATTQVNVADKFRDGVLFTFGFSLKGNVVKNGLLCSESASLSL